MSVMPGLWPYVLGVILIAVSLRLLIERLNRPTRRRSRSPALYRPNFDFDDNLTADEHAAEFDRVTDRSLHDTTGQPEPD